MSGIVAVADSIAMRDVSERCCFSTADFMRAFVPESVYRPFTANHAPLFDLLDDDTKLNTNFIGFRGLGKTTIVGQGFALRRICYLHDKFIVYVASSNTAACEKLEWVKAQLTGNELILNTFGNLQGPVWTVGEFITSTGIRMIARGANQQVRGAKHLDARPSLVVMDDLETLESVASVDQTMKIYRYVLSDVLNCGVPRRTRFVHIANMMHQECLGAKFMRDPTWRSVSIPLANEHYESHFPEYMTSEEVADLAKSYELRGESDIFDRDILCTVLNPRNAAFAIDKIPHMSLAEINSIPGYWIYFTVVDPAKTINPASAETGIVCFGVNPSARLVWVREVEAGKWHPDEQIRRAVDMAVRTGSRGLGVEVTSLHEYATQPFQNELKSRGRSYIELIELHARDKKETRVRGLIPYYRRGEMVHSHECGALETQLKYFPKSARWDVMDALAYMIPIMEKQYIYFHQQAGELPGKDEFEYLKGGDYARPMSGMVAHWGIN